MEKILIDEDELDDEYEPEEEEEEYNIL